MAIQNATNQYMFSAPTGQPVLTGVSFPRARLYVTSGADRTVYTCPAGKRALIGAPSFQETLGVSVTVTMKATLGGTLYTLGATTTVNAHASAGGASIDLVLEAGESVQASVNSNGVVCSLRVTEFDASNTQVVCPRLTSFSAGANTLYTCPAGKNAIMLGSSSSWPSSSTIGGMKFLNQSGATRTLRYSNVPSGGSAASNQFYSTASFTVNNGVLSGATMHGAQFEAGDFLNINVDAGDATQLAWTVLYEI